MSRVAGWIATTARWTPWLAAEFIVLFCVLPALIAATMPPTRIVPILLCIASVCFVVLWGDPSFDRSQLWRMGAWRPIWRTILLRFLAAAAVMTAITVVYEPARLLAFPRERPGIYALVMLLYPLLSVYPQGLIYRAFIIHRYRGLFGTGALAIIGSALAFGLAHVVLLNWIAPLFTLIGGLMFAHTYRKSGSLTIAAIEHAAYGNFLFTIGLGWYFYSGWRSGG